MANYEWLASKDLVARVLGNDGMLTGKNDLPDRWRLLVTDADLERAVILAIASDGWVTVNEERYDFGDDYPAILGIFDEVSEQVGGDGLGQEIFVPAPEK